MAPIKTNNPYASYFDFFSRSGTDASSAAPPGAVSGLTATGGIISDYEDSGTYYRAHVFTSSGALNVTALSTDPASLSNTVEYLVVAGGGGGGDDDAGGGGAGGFRTNLTGHPLKAADYTATVGSYTVTVGGGGAGSDGAQGDKGSNSEFYPTPVSYPSTARVRSVGGGGGYKTSDSPTQDGGSGGGSGWNAGSSTYGAGNTPDDPNHPQVQGYRGGACSQSDVNAGGGGGAGGVGQPGESPGASAGGIGIQCLISGSPANPQPVGAPGPGSGAAATGWFAGGGGGGGRDNRARYGGGGPSAPYSGGGTGGGPAKTVTPGTASSGGGGGGYGPSGGGVGGSGGSGIVVVRYQIVASQTGTAKATGGAISYYGGKTIHVFTSSGNFSVTNGPITTETLVIAGGGGGAKERQAGGGGGGGAVHHTSLTLADSTPYAIVVGGGAIGGRSATLGQAGTPSTITGSPITTITANGGGQGGGWPAVPGYAGGSGGGGGASPGTGGNGGGWAKTVILCKA